MIILVGPPGSGKAEAAAVLKSKGFEILDMGDIIREEMHKARLDINFTTDNAFPVEFRKKHGKDIVAKLEMKKANSLNAENICITGLRSAFELTYFKSVAPDLVLIAIDAPEEVRYRRLQSTRGRPEDPKTFEEFKARSEREAKGNTGNEEDRKAGLYAVMKMADYSISNSGTLEELRGSIEEVLQDLEQRNVRKA